MEMFDVYDDNKMKTGVIYEKGHALGENQNRLIVHVCIFNSKDEMLIQLREADHRNWADKWDITAGGCAQAGESSQEAMKRELKEEMGLDYDFSKLHPHMTIAFNHGFDDYYIIKKDIDISEVNFTDGEVGDARWASKEEILKLVEEEKFVKYFPAFINFLYDLKDRRSAYND